jgi:hypothetical protein
MLGKRTNKPNMANKSGGHGYRIGNTSYAANTRPKHARKAESSDDEEHGRSKLGNRTKSSAALAAEGQELSQNERDRVQIPSATAPSLGKSSKRGSSYLDQVLEERAARKKKSKKTTED